MSGYILKRLLMILPTLLGILLLNFAVVQFAPGGPVEQLIIQLTTVDAHQGAVGRIGGVTSDMGAQQSAVGAAVQSSSSMLQGTRGLDPQLIEDINRQYGFDKPAHERFLKMLGDYARFEFGTSFFRDEPVIDLVLDKLPVSISLGLWTTLFVYLISIPLGIRKAVRDGSAFDIYSSAAVIIGQAIPSFLFAILLIILFAGGEYWQWFPLRGLVSEGWDALPWPEKILDYLWHITLPVLAMVISGFASLTLLTKNSFIDEIGKQYVMTARAKGLSETATLYRHVFRNAMLIIIAGMPAALIGILFTSSLLIEVIFSLDGLGLLGFEAIMTRDYPVVFGTLFIFTLIGLITKLIGDLTYVLIDPRIDFESRRIG
jgi:microcin C transport system permease protein